MEVETPTTDTPVTTPETTPAAPATVETPQTPQTSERPASMLESLQRVAAEAEKSATPTETAATGQAAPIETPGVKQGPIPFEVHSKALDNARTKAASEAVAKVEAELGWARSVPKESLEQMSTIARDISADPMGFLERFIGELSASPQYAPQLRSQAARLLGGRTAAAPDLTPDVQIVDATGNVTGTTFSAERVQAIVAQAVNQAIGKEVAPLKQHYERQQADTAVREQTAQIESQADAILADAKEWEGFTEHMPAIAESLQQHPTWTVERAYLDVFKRDIRPSLDKLAEQRVIQNNNKKAAGNTANGTGAAATPGKPKTREELRRTLESLAGTPGT